MVLVMGINIIPTSATSSHYFDFQYLQLTTTVGTEIAFSVFVKPNGYNFIQIASSTGFAAKYQNFELTSGGIIGNGDINTSKIEKIGDWYRCSVTQDATGTNPRFLLITSQTALASRNVSFSGNGTDGILAWGYQVEEQSQATAYLKSDGVAAVRKATTTNLITYSEDFSNSFWSKTGSSVTSGITSPDGTNNAYSLIEDTSNGQHKIDPSNISITNATYYTSSIFAKKGLRDILQMVWSGTFGSSFVNFDLTNGTFSTNGSVIGKIETFTNGWYRCSITQATTATGLGRCQILLQNSISASRFGSYQGNGTGNIFVAFSQSEQQTQAETYAKTTGLPVTIDLFTENNYGTMTNMSSSDIVEDTP